MGGQSSDWPLTCELLLLLYLKMLKSDSVKEYITISLGKRLQIYAQFFLKEFYLNDNPGKERIGLVITTTPLKQEGVEISFTKSIWENEHPEQGTVFYLNFKTSD